MRAYPFFGMFQVTSLFGPRQGSAQVSSWHKGLDMVGYTIPWNTSVEIASAVDGVVEAAYWSNSAGNSIWIRANDPRDGLTFYCHLSKMYVSTGDVVKCKQPIGVQGTTGTQSTGTHLHFAVSYASSYTDALNNSDFVNPALWLCIPNPSTIKDKQFDGSGYVTGYYTTLNLGGGDAFYNRVGESNGVIGSSVNPNSVNSSVNYYHNDTSIYGKNTGSASKNRDVDSLNELLSSSQVYSADPLQAVEKDILFGRRYRVFINLSDGTALDVSELKCTFEIHKSMYMEVNTSSVTIYNLAPDTENKLINEGQTIIIEAGYTGSQYGMIFCGNVFQVLRGKEGQTDYYLTLVSVENDLFSTFSFIRTTLAAKQSARDAVEALSSRASIKSEVGKLTNFKINYPRGKVLFGAPKVFLEQISKSENAMYYTEDGKINIIGASDINEDEIFHFDATSGLLGTPEQSEYGVNCSVLLNPMLKVNDLFQIDNKVIRNREISAEGDDIAYDLDPYGIYRIVRLTHIGNTRDDGANSWVTNIEAVAQNGALPSMMMSSASLFG